MMEKEKKKFIEDIQVHDLKRSPLDVRHASKLVTSIFNLKYFFSFIKWILSVTKMWPNIDHICCHPRHDLVTAMGYPEDALRMPTMSHLPFKGCCGGANQK